MKAATNILNESSSTNHHEMRVNWANQVLSSNFTDQWINNNKWNILQNATIVTNGHSSSDNDIEFIISGLIPV